MKKRNKKIIRQAMVWIIGLFAAALLLNGFFIYYIHRRNHTNAARWRMQAVLLQAKENLAEYSALPWLISFWKEEGSTLELPGDFDERREILRRAFLSMDIDSVKEVTGLQAEGFDPATKRAFAEASYLEITQRIDSLKNNFEIGNLVFIAKEGDDKVKPIVQAKTREERALPESYSTMKAEWPFNVSLHPALLSMYETKEEKAYFEEIRSSIDDNISFLIAYNPILEDGEIIGCVYAAYTIDALNRTIMENTWLSELINAILLLSCGLLLLAVILRNVLKPLNFIMEHVEEYGRMKNSKEVIPKLQSIRADNEMGRLADNISDMIRETELFALQRQQAVVKSELAAAELSFAANIQSGSLPTDFSVFSERDGLDLYASMTPAKTVGGDFYDFFFLDEDHLYMAIADVSGKGVPAAMFMMVSKYILKSQALDGKPPAKLLEDANNAICANNKEQMFVTVWVGILEISSGKLVAANAGHEKPVICKGGGSFEFLKDPHGLVLGSIEGMEYEEYEVTLGKGSTLVVYTDGVVEATDKKEELFGNRRLLDALNRARDLSPESLISAVRGSVDDFVGGAEQFDDLTMLCVKTG